MRCGSNTGFKDDGEIAITHDSQVTLEGQLTGLVTVPQQGLIVVLVVGKCGKESHMRSPVVIAMELHMNLRTPKGYPASMNSCILARALIASCS